MEININASHDAAIRIDTLNCISLVFSKIPDSGVIEGLERFKKHPVVESIEQQEGDPYRYEIYLRSGIVSPEVVATGIYTALFQDGYKVTLDLNKTAWLTLYHQVIADPNLPPYPSSPSPS